MAAILSHCLRHSPLRVHSGPGDESVECFDHLGKVPMALDPPEPLLRLHECGRAPALSHRPPSPSLHSPRQAPESSIEVLDWVRRAERLQQPATHTKVDHSHGLLEPLTERRCRPRVSLIELRGEILQLSAPLLRRLRGPGPPDLGPHPAPLPLGQMIEHVADLVDLAALDQGPPPEHRSDRLAYSLPSVDHEQSRPLELQPPVD